MHKHNFPHAQNTVKPLYIRIQHIVQAFILTLTFIIASSLQAEEMQINFSSLKTLGDINNNGYPDYVAIQMSHSATQLVVFEYNESFEKVILWQKEQAQSLDKWVDVNVSDLNLNGKPEVIAISQNYGSSNNKNPVSWLSAYEWDVKLSLFTEIISVKKSLQGNILPNPKKLLIRDISGDGSQNIVIHLGYPEPAILIGSINNINKMNAVSWRIIPIPTEMSENPASINWVFYEENALEKVALVQKQDTQVLLAKIPTKGNRLNPIHSYEMPSTESYEIFYSVNAIYSDKNGLNLFAGTNKGNIYQISDSLNTIKLWHTFSSPVKAIYIDDYDRDDFNEIFIQLHLSSLYLEQLTTSLDFDSFSKLMLKQNLFPDMLQHPLIGQHYIIEQESNPEDKEITLNPITTAEKINVVEEHKSQPFNTPPIPVLKRKTHEKKTATTRKIEKMLHVGETFNHSLPSQDILEPSEAGLQFLAYPKGAHVIEQKQFSWTPTKDQLGFHEIHYLFGTKIDTSFYIYVNDPPIINSIAPDHVQVGHQYAYQIKSFDNNDDAIIEYYLREGPNGITIDNFGLLLWTPIQTQLDYQHITVAISDGYAIDEQDFDVYVNSMPMTLQTPTPVAIINKQYTGKLIFEDKNVPNQAYVTIVSSPIGLELEENGNLTWTPTEHQIGFHDIVYELCDIYTTQVDSFTLYVNSPPKVTSTPKINASVGYPWRYTVKVEDKNDNQDISYLIHNSTIPNLNISRKGRITWTPSNAHLDHQSFIISISDGIQDVLQEVNLFVNSPPVIHSVIDTTAVTQQQYHGNINVTDLNENQKLIYTLSQKPSGMTVSSKGEITWTPDNFQTGFHDVFFSIDDGLAKAKGSFKIFVNAPPEFISIPKELTIVNEEYRYAVNVQDRNREQILTVAIDKAPKGVKLVDNILTWTPKIENLNTQYITLSVSDGSLVETQDLALFVNALPEVYSEPKVAVISNQDYTYTLSTRDANGDEFSYKTIFLPPGAIFNNLNATLTWTPTAEQEGSNEVIIKITDSHNQSTIHKYNLYVFQPPKKKGFFSRMFGK